MWWNDLDAMAEALSTLAPRTDPSARVSPRATLQGPYGSVPAVASATAPMSRVLCRSAATA